MPSMNATDLTRVKALMGETGNTLDAALTAWIAPVSDVIERFLARPLLKTARTEVVPVVRPYQTSITLSAYPVDTGLAVTIKEALDRNFAGTTAKAASEYFLEGETGIVRFDVPLLGGNGVLQVAYTGGMGADVAGLETAFPAVVRAASIEVQFRYDNRKTLGQASHSLGGAAVTFLQGREQLCPEARSLLLPFQRVRFS